MLFLILHLHVSTANRKTVPAPSFTYGKKQNFLIGQFTHDIRPSESPIGPLPQCLIYLNYKNYEENVQENLTFILF